MKKQFQPLTSAALYARVSSDRQDVDLSVAAQRRALRDYARNNGYSVACEYVDKAESGRIADRPQFRQMIDEGGRPRRPSGAAPNRAQCRHADTSGILGNLVFVIDGMAVAGAGRCLHLQTKAVARLG